MISERPAIFLQITDIKCLNDNLRVNSRSLPQKKQDSDCRHILLVDCTLILVIVQFLPVMQPQACPVIMLLCLLVHCCAPFIRRIQNLSQVILTNTVSMSQTKS